MRQAPKLDSNQLEIVNALRGRGASVQSLAAIGRGCPDLLIGIHGINIVAEVKAHKAGTVAGEPNPDQARWIAEWRGVAVVIRDLEDVGRVVEMARARSAATELLVGRP
jgi:Holliday junction resolvase